MQLGIMCGATERTAVQPASARTNSLSRAAGEGRGGGATNRKDATNQTPVLCSATREGKVVLFPCVLLRSSDGRGIIVRS